MKFLRSQSLKVKISGILIGVIVLISLVAGYIVRAVISDIIYSQLSAKGIAILKTVVLRVDPEQFRQLAQTLDSVSPFYEKMRLNFNRVKYVNNVVIFIVIVA